VFDCDGTLTSAMRLNFTRNTPDRLAEGVRRLRRAVERHLSSQSNGGV
jgi:2-aminoadipate transaminase